ncbi:hypothetical protein ACLB2K_046907 [Fragaria x ananassa]
MSRPTLNFTLKSKVNPAGTISKEKLLKFPSSLNFQIQIGVHTITTSETKNSWTTPCCRSWTVTLCVKTDAESLFLRSFTSTGIWSSDVIVQRRHFVVLECLSETSRRVAEQGEVRSSAAGGRAEQANWRSETLTLCLSRITRMVGLVAAVCLCSSALGSRILKLDFIDRKL